LLLKNVTTLPLQLRKKKSNAITSPLFKKINYNGNGVISNALLSNPDLYHMSKQASSLVSIILEIGRDLGRRKNWPNCSNAISYFSFRPQSRTDF